MINLPYKRTFKEYTQQDINTWEKITLGTGPEITKELRGKTFFVSPVVGKPGREQNHHRLELELNGPGPINVHLAHATTESQWNRVLSTHYYTIDFHNIKANLTKEFPARYGGRNHHWWLIQDTPHTKITSLKHWYHQCPDEWKTHWMHQSVLSHPYLGGEMKYAVSFPPNYNSEDKTNYPLIISVGGSGEIGNDGRILVQTNPSCVITRDYKFYTEYPAIHVTIQIPNPSDFTESIPRIPFTYPYHSSWNKYYGEDGYGATGARQIIEKLIHNPDFNIDVNRIYLTGFSGGGLFCYEALKGIRDVFAAVVPIAAWPIGQAYENIKLNQYWETPPPGRADTLKQRLIKEMKRGRHIPTTVVAGSKDNMKHGTTVFKELADELHMDCTLKILQGVNHGSSPKVFWGKQEHVDWIFSQSKNDGRRVPVDPYPGGRYSSSVYLGDFNTDGVVDYQDIKIYINEENKTGSKLQADPNLDGVNNELDLNIIKKQYNNTEISFDEALIKARQPDRKPFLPPRRSFRPPRRR